MRNRLLASAILLLLASARDAGPGPSGTTEPGPVQLAEATGTTPTPDSPTLTPLRMTTAATAPLSFADSGQCLGSAQSWGVTLGDLDDDGDLDAFVANAMQGGVGNVVWLNDGQSGFILGEQSGGYGQGVVLGDVDGDNDLDALVGSWWGEETSLVWLNDGSGSFAASGQTLGSGRCFDAALGDLDGDGDLNALIAHGDRRRGSGGRVWLNDGRGHFGDSDLRLSDSHSSDVALGDLDGDGDLDALSHTANCGRRAVVEWLIQYG